MSRLARLGAWAATALIAVACTIDQAGTGNDVSTDASAGNGGSGAAPQEGGAAAGGTSGTSGWPDGAAGASDGTAGAAGESGAGGTGASAGASGTGGTSGTGGASGTGGTSGDPCNGLCKDANATCAKATCACNAGFTNTDTSGNPMTATCAPNKTITAMTVTVAIAHTSCDELVIKLQAPSGTVMTLMSRPGYAEQADDGAPFVANPGSPADLAAGNPVTFSDAATVSAEQMGTTLNWNQTVCKDDGICDYKPDKGATASPGTLAAAFNGQVLTGAWTLCVGDVARSAYDGSGSLKSWYMNVTTVDGKQPTVNSGGINITIPNDKYDGSLGSMGCSTIQAP